MENLLKDQILFLINSYLHNNMQMLIKINMDDY